MTLAVGGMLNTTHTRRVLSLAWADDLDTFKGKGFIDNRGILLKNVLIHPFQQLSCHVGTLSGLTQY